MLDTLIKLVGNPTNAHDSVITFDNMIDVDSSMFVGDMSILFNRNDFIAYWNFINNWLKMDIPTYVDRDLIVSDLIEVCVDRNNNIESSECTVDVKYMKRYVENGSSIVIKRFEDMVDVYEVSMIDKYNFPITKNLYKCVIDADGYEYPNIVPCYGM
jgi:hypothetical protein